MSDIRTIASLSLLDILPENLLADKQVYAAAKSLDDELQRVTASCVEVLHLPRLDELPEAVVDLLAWQWHVDFYEPDADIRVKRRLVRESIAWHRIKGTKSAVEGMIRTIFQGGVVTEWFDYGGEPYHFRVDLLSAPKMTPENTERLLYVVNASKNVRSVLDELTYRRDMQGSIHYGAAPSLHMTYEIRPAEIADTQADAQHYLGGAPLMHTCYEVYPTVVQDAQTSVRRYIGGIGDIHTTYEVTET